MFLENRIKPYLFEPESSKEELWKRFEESGNWKKEHEDSDEAPADSDSGWYDDDASESSCLKSLLPMMLANRIEPEWSEEELRKRKLLKNEIVSWKLRHFPRYTKFRKMRSAVVHPKIFIAACQQ